MPQEKELDGAPVTFCLLVLAVGMCLFTVGADRALVRPFVCTMEYVCPIIVRLRDEDLQHEYPRTLDA